MKTKFKKYAALFMVLSAALLFVVSGCIMDDFQIADKPELAGNKGYITLSVNGVSAARTIFPVGVTFERYEASIYDGDDNLVDSGTWTDDENIFILDLDVVYKKIVVRAYINDDDDDFAAEGIFDEAFTLTANERTKDISIDLIPVEEGEGTFSWAVTLHESIVGFTIKIDGGDLEDPIEIVVKGTEAAADTSVSLEKGLYKVEFALTYEDGTTITLPEDLYIFAGMESVYTRTFGERSLRSLLSYIIASIEEGDDLYVEFFTDSAIGITFDGANFANVTGKFEGLIGDDKFPTDLPELKALVDAALVEVGIAARYPSEDAAKAAVADLIKNGSQPSYKLVDGTLTITIGAYTVTATITTVESIKIITPPTRETYLVGQSLDLSGIEVEVTYSDGEKGSADIANLTTDPTGVLTEPGTDIEVTVTYGGKTDTFTITVYDNYMLKPGDYFITRELSFNYPFEGRRLMDDPEDLEAIRNAPRYSYLIVYWAGRGTTGTTGHLETHPLDEARRINISNGNVAPLEYVQIPITSVWSVMGRTNELPGGSFNINFFNSYIAAGVVLHIPSEAPPSLTITLVNKDGVTPERTIEDIIVTGRNGDVTYLHGNTGFKFDSSPPAYTGGHRGKYAWFKVDFGDKKLSDYSEVKFMFKVDDTLDGRRLGLMAQSTPFPNSLPSHQAHSGGSGNGFLASYQVTEAMANNVNPTEVPIEVTLEILPRYVTTLDAFNELYLSIYEHTNTDAVITISDIRFIEREPGCIWNVPVGGTCGCDAAISAVKTEVESATYTAVSAGTIELARSRVETIIGGLNLNNVTATVVDGEFTAAQVGVPGTYTFTVELRRGEGTMQTTDILTLNIDALPDEPFQPITVWTLAEWFASAHTSALTTIASATASRPMRISSGSSDDVEGTSVRRVVADVNREDSSLDIQLNHSSHGLNIIIGTHDDGLRLNPIAYQYEIRVVGNVEKMPTGGNIRLRYENVTSSVSNTILTITETGAFDVRAILPVTNAVPTSDSNQVIRFSPSAPGSTSAVDGGVLKITAIEIVNKGPR